MRSVASSPAPHIVWDWNGTLLDDNDAVIAAVNTVCDEFGRSPVTLEQWRAMYRRPLLASYEELLERPISPREWETLECRYHEEYNARLATSFGAASARQQVATVRLADGVPEALHEWRQAGNSQSLLSMWFHRDLVRLVAELGLDELFSRVDGLREEIGGGSKARHLAAHLEAQHIAPKDVLVVGDVTDDADAAREVGAGCILVTTGMMGREALAGMGVRVAGSVSAALNLIK